MRARGSALAAAALAFGVLGGGVAFDAAPAEAASARTGSKQTAPSANRATTARTPAVRGVVRASERRGSAAPRAGSVRRVAYGGGGGAAAWGGEGWGGRISCVPYARAASGIEVRGNGGAWWHNAAGTYERGQRPEPGAVFVFRAGAGGTRLGHVAVVERQVGPREILIHHANWAGPGIRRGTVMRGVSVVDVSERGDWTAVRVQVGHSDEAYGRTYATHGFIYDRPEGAGGGGTMYAAAARRSPAPYAPAAPRYEEVAEAPAHAAPAPHRAAAAVNGRQVHVMQVSHRASYDLSVDGAYSSGRR